MTSPDWHLPIAEGFTDKAIITTANQISNQAFEEIAQKLELRGLRTPISQITGFAQFQAQAAPVVTADETTASGTYTNLATVGPEIDALPDGKYLLLYGALVTAPGSGRAFVAPKINSTEADDADAAQMYASNGGGVSFAVTKTLSGGNNTILLRYRTSGGGTGTFGLRWLIVLRYSN
jgi:hypothetical protein